nr:T9SS type A sorting domain-containing protein [uncultured Flavobacterium sp.]
MKLKTLLFFLKQNLLWFVLLFTSVAWAQYNGTGVFAKVNTTSVLSNGYYVITDKDSNFLMQSNNSGNFFGRQQVSIRNEKTENPSVSNVWKIQNQNGGLTLFSENTNKYVAYNGSQNHAYALENLNNGSTWIQNLSAQVFSIKNKSSNSRRLAYNNNNPRFATYDNINANQVELQAYKLIAPFLEKEFCGNVTVAVLSNSAEYYKWYSSLDGENPLDLDEVVETGFYYVSVVIGDYESERTQVAITINSSSGPIVQDQFFCNEARISNLPQGNNNYKWYLEPLSGLPLSSDYSLLTRTYYVSKTENGCESTRTPVEVVVIPTPDAPVALAQTFCSVEAKKVSDLVATGSGLKWYENETTSDTLDATELLVSETYYVSQTVNDCESSRTPVEVVVIPTPDAPVALTQTFCSVEAKKVSDLIATGSGLKWYLDATIPTELDTTELLVSRTYYVSQTVNNCESPRTSVVVVVNQTPDAPVALDQTFCSVEGKKVSDLIATGSGLKWYENETTSDTLDPTELLVSKTYYVSQTVNNCESPRTAVAVVVNQTPNAPTAEIQTFCSVEGKKVSDLVATGSGLKWYSDATIPTEIDPTELLVSETYYVSQTVNNCESPRTSVLVVVNQTPDAPSVTVSPFCGSATIADLPQGNGTYKWYTSLTTETALSTSTELETATYYVSQVVLGCESSKTLVEVIINPIPSAPSVTVTPFCGSATIADLPQGNGTYKWYTSLTAETALTTSTELETNTYYVSQTVLGCESPKTLVAVTINPIPAAPSVTVPSFCGSATVADLPQGNGTYKWYSSSTSETPLSDTIDLVNGTTYYVSVTTLECESPRTSVEIVINEIPTAPTVTVPEFCGSATAADLPKDNGIYKWYQHLTGGSVLADTTVLTNGTTYYVSVTVNGCESPRTAKTIVVKTVPTAPTVVLAPFCESATVSQLPQGTSPEVYKWYDVATGGEALAATTTLANGQTYYVSVTVNGCESLRTPVSLVIYPKPDAPEVTAQMFCDSAIVSDLPQGNGTYKWYSTETVTVELAENAILMNNKTYYVSLTENGCESERTAVLVSINPTPVAPTVEVADFCGPVTVADLPNGNGTYKWYSSLTSETALASTFDLSNGTSYFVSQTINGCESPRTEKVVVIKPIPNAPSVTVAPFCGPQTIADLPQGNGNYKWYSAAIDGNELALDTNLVTGTTYYVSTTVNGCESLRTAVQIFVNNVPDAPVVTTQSFCDFATLENLPQGDGTYKWYNSEASTDALALNSVLVNDATYYVSKIINGCESTKTAVLVNVFTTPNAPVIENQIFCFSAKVSDLPTGDGNYKWYASLDSTIALQNNINLINGATYYVSETNGNCNSTRTAVTVTINNLPSVIVSNVQNLCGFSTVSDLIAFGEPNAEILWYNSSESNVPLSNNTILSQGTYFVSQRLGECESRKTTVAVRISTSSAPNVAPFNFCGSAVVADLEVIAATGVTHKWYASMNSTTELTVTTPLISGTYYVSRVQFGCESFRAPVTVTIHDIPNSPTGVANQTFMEGSVINHLVVEPTTAAWFITEEDAMNLNNQLMPNMPLVQGTTYYAVNIGTNGCPSLPFAVTVDITLDNTDFVKHEVKYYPNPVLDYLTIDHTDVIEQVVVYNTLGQFIYAENYNDTSIKVNFSSFASGSYILKLKTKNGETSLKVVKQ